MKHFSALLIALSLSLLFSGTLYADSIMKESTMLSKDETVSTSFPDLSEKIIPDNGYAENNNSKIPVEVAFWPFGKKSDSGQEQASAEKTMKSPRKAFFLSFLFPGLGEAYVGSKRGYLFLGIEALAWWMYVTNTNDGNDAEDKFHNFADNYWHYTDTYDSNGDSLDFNYWEWVKWHLKEVGYTDARITPDNYAYIDSLLQATTENANSSIYNHSVHNLPSTKTQQYYEMIGKYPQFVYGWEDIDDLNANVRDTTTGKIKYEEQVQNVSSNLRLKYENMRDDSNDKLKAGQRGIYLMILNRVVSAIDAGRLAYNHNKKMNSEMSMVRVQFVQKRINDNNVPMLMLTKKF